MNSGNALFLILIAVALFAALSYAVTNAGQGGGSIDKEKELLKEAETNNCTAYIERGLNKLQYLNGCSKGEISYELADGTNANDDAPANKSCHLFHPNGADMSPCGIYTDPIVFTGTIDSHPDTTTIVLMPTGIYFKCLNWVGSTCLFGISEDGINFTPQDRLCLKKGDGTDDSRDNSGGPVSSPFRSAMCNAACGGGSSGGGGLMGGAPQYYLNDDLTISPHTGSCSYMLRQTRCTCW